VGSDALGAGSQWVESGMGTGMALGDPWVSVGRGIQVWQIMSKHQATVCLPVPLGSFALAVVCLATHYCYRSNDLDPYLYQNRLMSLKSYAEVLIAL
jgi:hypothetical protein